MCFIEYKYLYNRFLLSEIDTWLLLKSFSTSTQDADYNSPEDLSCNAIMIVGTLGFCCMGLDREQIQ